MDVGNKTLSQLSDEAKEKRYVSLEVGAKISGYTKEYLDHLCRLNKVEYRQWNNGQFVVELDSLLAETHTLLLSYEDINFVDKKELIDVTPEVAEEAVKKTLEKNSDGSAFDITGSERLFSENNADGITQNIPTFGNPNRTQGGSPFSFVGRVVVSDPTHRDNFTDADTQTPISLGSVPTQMNAVVVETPIPAPTPSVLAKEPDTLPVLAHSLGQVTRNPIIHLTVLQGDDDHSSGNKGGHNKKDDWDAAFLAQPTSPSRSAPIPQPKVEVASPHHPIKTSVDASEHHEDLPLFPRVGRPLSGRDSVERTASVHNVIHHALVERKENMPVVTTTPRVPMQLPPTPPVAPTKSAISSSTEKKNSSIIPRIKVMPQVPMNAPTLLMRTNEEHHLILREKYPLIKSVGFNAAIALFMLGSGALLWSGILANSPIFSNSNSYVAAVAESLPPSVASVATSSTMLPFSDEVNITRNKMENGVLIQPVFRDAASGDTYEYTVVEQKAVDSTGVRE